MQKYKLRALRRPFIPKKIVALQVLPDTANKEKSKFSNSEDEKNTNQKAQNEIDNLSHKIDANAPAGPAAGASSQGRKRNFIREPRQTSNMCKAMLPEYSDDDKNQRKKLLRNRISPQFSDSESELGSFFNGSHFFPDKKKSVYDSNIHRDFKNVHELLIF